jgi:3-hydroxyisobutyrate dehydrogenase-like beta-hydroxyacid dehydrogenase
MSDATKLTVGFIGLGHMGRPMVARLAVQGFTVRAWNRTREKAAGLAGVTLCGSPREAASGADVVVSSLANDVAVRQVVLDADGVVAGLGRGAVHVGTSTISVGLVDALVGAHQAAGASFVASPVLGRPDAAARGELWILAGGDDAALARAQPVLAALGQGQVRLGDARQAMLGKIAANFVIASTIEIIAEATTLGEKGGIPPAALVGMLTQTLFGSPVFKGYGARIAAREFEPAGFAMPLGLKDVELALDAGHELRVPLPTAALVRDHLLAALARGRDGWDWAGLASVVREAAGLG